MIDGFVEGNEEEPGGLLFCTEFMGIAEDYVPSF